MPLASLAPLLSLAAGVVGTGLSIAGNAKAKREMESVRGDYARKQAEHERESNAIFKKSLSESTPDTAVGQMSKGASERTALYQSLKNASTPIASALSATGETPTSKAVTRAGATGNAWNNLTAGAQAKEGGYGDWQNDQTIKNADVSQKLGVINDFSRGDANLLPLQLKVASEAGDKLSSWGNIVNSLGRVAGAASSSFGGIKTPQLAPQGSYFENMMDIAGKNAFSNKLSIGGTPSIWKSIYGG